MQINPEKPGPSYDQSGFGERPLDEEIAMHTAFDEWAGSLLVRNGSNRLAIMPYDPEDPYQQIDVVKVEALRPRVSAVYEGGCAMLGEKNFSDFVNDLRRQANNPGQPGSVLKTIKGRLAVPGQNVALITNHANLLDIGVAQAGLFCALEDPAIADQSGIIVNKLITRLTFDGVPAVNLLRASGNVYFCLPRSDSARNFKIGEETADRLNGNMLKVLLRDTRDIHKQNKSMLLAVAPSGSTARPVTDPATGKLTGLEIPQAQQTTINMIERYFNFLLPLSLRIDKKPDSSRWRIGGLNSIRQSKYFDEAMRELAGQTAELYKTNVSYGDYVARYEPHLARKLASALLKIEKSGR